MKSLKLNHDLAQAVARGEKTSTWRVFDEKDISVDDDVVLIDKVDPKNRQTWAAIGVAHVNRVIEKRLGDVSEQDFVGHEHYADSDKMLAAYRSYYGPSVSLQTPIKLIDFSFTPYTEPEQFVDKNTTSTTEVILYADGGSRGNPGPSAAGFVIVDDAGSEHKILHEAGVYLGVTTNNQAEYQALKFGLEEARKIGIRTVHVRMDSMLVVNQMKGIFKVKNRDLWPIYDATKRLVNQFEKVTFTHVPRELNKLADAEVNKTLDERFVADA